jgi:hypothetical protein
MKTQAIYLAIILVLLCTSADAQSEKATSLVNQRVPHRSAVGINALPGTPHPFRVDIFTREGLKRSTLPLRRTLSPLSHIYVVDTAIVLSTKDTTRHLYSFNASAKRTSDVTQKLIGTLWVESLRQTNTYDSRDNMLSDAHEYWENDAWVNAWRSTYTYDANGNGVTELVQQWSNAQWVNLFRYTHTYDGNGNMLTELWEDWSNGQWVKDDRYTYTYDANGNMLSTMDESWSTDQWVNSYRYSYTYDESGHILSEMEETWSNGEWLKSWRWTDAYNANGKQISNLRETWSNGQWINDYRYTYTYDANGNMLSMLWENWSNGQWMNDYRYTYTSDTNGHLTSLWHYGWLNSSWVPTDIGLVNTWLYLVAIADSASNYYFFLSCYNVTFTYKIIVTGVVSESGNVPETYSLSQNYPNPFNPSTTIRYGLPHKTVVQLTVFNTLGQQVAQLVNGEVEAGFHDVKCDGKNLSSGVYFYRILAGEFVQTRKFLLVR